MKTDKNLSQKGAITFIVLALTVMGLIISGVLLLVDRSSLFSQNVNYTLDDVQAVNLAEAGIDKAVAALNLSSTYNGGSYPLGEGEVVITVTVDPLHPSARKITTSAFIPSLANPRVNRQLTVVADKVSGLGFPYAIHAGVGGINMGNNSQINNGSVYSNGPVVLSNNNFISDNLWVAGGTTIAPAVSNDGCSGATCSFGYVGEQGVNAANDIDQAQSFIIPVSGKLVKIAVAMKKVGNPTTDLAIGHSPNTGSGMGRPSGAGLFWSAPYAQFTTDYAWIETMIHPYFQPNLVAGTKYWIVVNAASGSNTNYWHWRATTNNSYASGDIAVNNDWQAGTGWTYPAGDHIFKVYIDTSTGPTSAEGIVDGGNGSTVGGNVYANTIRNLKVNGHAYYQSIDLVSKVGGIPCVNVNCHPGQPNPPVVEFPITPAMIDSWKQEASAGGILTGNISTCAAINNLGPKQITGDVTLANNCNVTLKSPIYITGTLTLQNSNTLNLDPTYGQSSGVIIVKGKIVADNGNIIQGTGANSSTIFLVSEYASTYDADPAIEVKNSGNLKLVVFAPNGIVEGKNNNTFEAILAKRVLLKNNNNINVQVNPYYSQLEISGGTSGEYSVVKGTYRSL